MTFISAMYEYAATDIAGNKCAANLTVTYIAVGPSAPPIIPVAAASSPVNPILIAMIKVTNIPS